MMNEKNKMGDSLILVSLVFCKDYHYNGKDGNGRKKFMYKGENEAWL